LDEIGYLDHRRTHLFVFDLAAKSLTQLTSGDYDDSEPAWSPDGQLLAFTSNRSKPDPDLTYTPTSGSSPRIMSPALRRVFK